MSKKIISAVCIFSCAFFTGAVFAATTDTTATATSANTAKSAVAKVKSKKAKKTKVQSTSMASRVKDLEAKISELTSSFNKHEVVSDSKIAILTTPTAKEASFTGGDKLVNVDYTGRDMYLLGMSRLMSNNGIDADKPAIVFSGRFDAMAYSAGSYWNSDATLSRMEMNNVRLASAVKVNNYLTGLAVIKYDGSHDFTYPTYSSDSLSMENAFFVVGNLDECPAFASFGKMYVPFGKYTGWSIQDPLTKLFGIMLEPTVTVGFMSNGAYGQLFAFNGTTHEWDNDRKIKNWGAKLGYADNINGANFDIGAGYVANIADSKLLRTIFTSWQEHRVAAADVYATLTYNPVAFAIEYVGATQKFDILDATYNGKGARPAAFDVEGKYAFDISDKPSYVSAGYDRTWQAAGLDLSSYTYYASFGVSLIKNTVQSIEFSRAYNYEATDTASVYSSAVSFAGDRKFKNTVLVRFKASF